MKISEFNGQYRWLSNFWPSTIELDGEIYPTVEHAYQASKSLQEGVRKQFAFPTPLTPGQAKRLGRQIEIRPDWELIKRMVMGGLLVKKFSGIILRQKLLDTGDAILEEGNNWGDRYWGICPPNSGQGENVLGKLLMDVRKELRNEEQKTT